MSRAKKPTRSSARAPRTVARETIPDPAPGALTRTLLITLAVMVAARAIASFVPSMWAWSINLQRFLHPAIAVVMAAATALVLIPAVARSGARAITGAGDALAGGSWIVTCLVMAGAAGLVWLLPDVVRFVGDFLIRQGTVEVADKPSVLFPQALPLDIWLHYTLPSWLTDRRLTDANGAARLLGVVEAALLALVSLRMARLLDARGATAWVVVATVTCGGALAMYTGFGKAFAELALLTAWTGVAGLSAVRGGPGLLEVGIAVAIAAGLHRSGLALVPAAVLAWVMWARRNGAGVWKRPVTWIAALVPLAALAIMIPRIAAIVRRWDTEHFRPGGASGAALVAQTLTAERFADMANVLVMLAPLLLLALVIVPALRDAPRRRADERPGSELAYLIALALPFLAVMPVLHPAQGMYRDLDDFAATGIAVSLVAAWLLARGLRSQPAWLAFAIAVSGAIPTLQWLAVHHDLDRGIARVRAFMVEPPIRTPNERATTWDFLGARYFRLGQEADQDGRLDAAHAHFIHAVEAFENAAKDAPSPRILQEWALAATMKGDFALAHQVYLQFLEKDPTNVLGWLGLATVSLNRGDLPEARRGANELLKLRPGEPVGIDLLQKIDRLEARMAPPANP